MKLPTLETHWLKLCGSFAVPRILIIALPVSGILHDEPVKLEPSLSHNELYALRSLLWNHQGLGADVSIDRLCRFLWFRQQDSPWNPPDRRTLVGATGRLFGIYALVTNTLN